MIPVGNILSADLRKRSLRHSCMYYLEAFKMPIIMILQIFYIIMIMFYSLMSSKQRTFLFIFIACMNDDAMATVRP